MKKIDETVSIRVSKKARERLKWMALKQETTIIKIVDSLVPSKRA